MWHHINVPCAECDEALEVVAILMSSDRSLKIVGACKDHGGFTWTATSQEIDEMIAQCEKNDQILTQYENELKEVTE